MSPVRARAVFSTIVVGFFFCHNASPTPRNLPLFANIANIANIAAINNYDNANNANYNRKVNNNSNATYVYILKSFEAYVNAYIVRISNFLQQASRSLSPLRSLFNTSSNSIPSTASDSDSVSSNSSTNLDQSF